MTTNLPAPPVPPSIDLQGLPYMPLDVVRLRDSEIAVRTKGDEFRCAVLLWCASWHQLPAASLPDDDLVLAQLAGFGRVVRDWRRVREGALRGFVKCSDGRLYHWLVAEKALDAWRGRLEQRWRTECARLKKAHQRTGDPVEILPLEAWVAREFPDSVPYFSPTLSPGEPGAAVSLGYSCHVPRTEGARPQGQEPMSHGKRHPREVKRSSSNTYLEGGSSSARASDRGVGDQPPDPGVLGRIGEELTRGKVTLPDGPSDALRLWVELGVTPTHVAKAIALARSPGAKPYPQELTIAYLGAVLERVRADEGKIRRDADARVERTQEIIEESRAAEKAAVPPPPEISRRYGKRAQGGTP